MPLLLHLVRRFYIVNITSYSIAVYYRKAQTIQHTFTLQEIQAERHPDVSTHRLNRIDLVV